MRAPDLWAIAPAGDRPAWLSVRAHDEPPQQIRRSSTRRRANARGGLADAGQAPDDQATPATPFIKPFLWIIAAGRPSSVLSLLGAAPAPGWPPGAYLSPGKPLDADERPPDDPPDPGGMLRVGILVASELPRDPSTILVRLMAGGAALPAALSDLAALPAGVYEREVASMDVLELRKALGSRPNRTVEEEDFIVTTQNIVEELRDEGRKEGRDQGRDEGRVEEAARAVLTVLRVRGVTVPDAARERIVTQKDRERLESWLEKAAVAASVGDVIDEPS